mmetsp:Transcript_12162/g.37058  ORF Transcript_12162/g.37058 Transcript_12162/m.37058 type:complete len:364 (-) Transcript_12162:72-1163(-)
MASSWAFSSCGDVRVCHRGKQTAKFCRRTSPRLSAKESNLRRIEVALPTEHTLIARRNVQPSKTIKVVEEQPRWESPPVRSVLAYSAVVTALAAVATAAMRGKLPALANKMPKVDLPLPLAPFDLNAVEMVPAEIRSVEDFAPDYQQYTVVPSAPLELELGQRIAVRAGGVIAPVLLVSKRQSDALQFILPSSLPPGALSEEATEWALSQELQEATEVSVGVVKNSGLHYRGQELPVTQLAIVAGGAAAIASACAQMSEILEDKETSVEEATLIAYCSTAESFGEALVLLEDLERRFANVLTVQCAWSNGDTDASAESLAVERLPPWSHNSMTVVLGPKRFARDVAKLATAEKQYPDNVVLTE